MFLRDEIFNREGATRVHGNEESSKRIENKNGGSTVTPLAKRKLYVCEFWSFSGIRWLVFYYSRKKRYKIKLAWS